LRAFLFEMARCIFEKEQEIQMGSSTYAGSLSQSGKTNIIGGERGKGPGPEVLSADSFEGEDVVNVQGENLGDIKEIMIDVQNGRVAYAVLSSGGFLGLGDKLFAIPWSALTLDADRKCFVLDIDKERLKNAPGFDKGNWPSMADLAWAQKIHDYYGQTSYWSTPNA
jgi:sporulation protein YlmC with PRC-barrel domain